MKQARKDKREGSNGDPARLASVSDPAGENPQIVP